MTVLVTGGAGFIGANLTASLAERGVDVRVLDNLSRKGVRQNARWLAQHHGSRVEIREGDIRDCAAVQSAVQGVDQVFHLAGQVAVTTSVDDPRTDFDVNALGTLNVLEAVRQAPKPPTLLYTSTNKVYGGMEDQEVVESAGRYQYESLPNGVSEERGLDFHSPYGCSKGAADQYVRDYARIYDLKTIVFRMSCIYGPRQFGNEDQGWVAHFARAVLKGDPIRVYGDGKQIRDVLYVDDLVRAFTIAMEQSDRTAGQVYNIGGGPENTLSLLELIRQLEEDSGKKIEVTFHPWRPGDQRVYVSDTRKAAREFGWKPQVTREAGVRKLADWLATPDAELA